MARIVRTETEITKGFTIVNLYRDETNKHTTFYENEIITDFRFTGKNIMKILTGRVSKIDFNYKKLPTTNFVTKSSCLLNDAVVKTVTMDFSTEYNSNVEIVPMREILEYNADREVVKVEILPVMKVKIVSYLSDDTKTEIVLEEGMKLLGLTIIRGGKEVSGDFELISFLYDTKTKLPNGIYITNNNDTGYKVYFESIKVCGTSGTVVKNGESLTDAINKYIEESTNGPILLTAGTFTDDSFEFGNMTIEGAQHLVSANIGERCTDNLLADTETIINGTINMKEGSEVVLSGLTFTGNSSIKLNNAYSVTFKNCRFIGVQPEKTKTFLITNNTTAASESGVLIQFDGCYFGTNCATDIGKMYNLFELNCKITNGSYIKNCYFAKSACAHNVINLYDVDEGSVIDVKNNYFEYSANAIRIGFRGNAKCTVNVVSNTYRETDSDLNYAGLVLVQPYAKKTESFENVLLNINNNQYTGDVEHHIWYIYTNKSDTQITEQTQPQVYVNSVQEFWEFSKDSETEVIS